MAHHIPLRMRVLSTKKHNEKPCQLQSCYQINRVAANTPPTYMKKNSVDEEVKQSMFLRWLSLTSNWLEQINPVSVGLSDPYGWIMLDPYG